MSFLGSFKMFPVVLIYKRAPVASQPLPATEAPFYNLGTLEGIETLRKVLDGYESAIRSSDKAEKELEIFRCKMDGILSMIPPEVDTTGLFDLSDHESACRFFQAKNDSVHRFLRESAELSQEFVERLYEASYPDIYEGVKSVPITEKMREYHRMLVPDLWEEMRVVNDNLPPYSYVFWTLLYIEAGVIESRAPWRGLDAVEPTNLEGCPVSTLFMCSKAETLRNKMFKEDYIDAGFLQYKKTDYMKALTTGTRTTFLSVLENHFFPLTDRQMMTIVRKTALMSTDECLKRFDEKYPDAVKHYNDAVGACTRKYETSCLKYLLSKINAGSDPVLSILLRLRKGDPSDEFICSFLPFPDDVNMDQLSKLLYYAASSRKPKSLSILLQHPGITQDEVIGCFLNTTGYSNPPEDIAALLFSHETIRRFNYEGLVHFILPYSASFVEKITSDPTFDPSRAFLNGMVPSYVIIQKLHTFCYSRDIIEKLRILIQYPEFAQYIDKIAYAAIHTTQSDIVVFLHEQGQLSKKAVFECIVFSLNMEKYKGLKLLLPLWEAGEDLEADYNILECSLSSTKSTMKLVFKTIDPSILNNQLYRSAIKSTHKNAKFLLSDARVASLIDKE